MFNSILKKLGEAEQEFSKNLTASPSNNAAAPAVHMPETILHDDDNNNPESSELQKLQRLVEKYKNQLAFGAREYNKLLDDNERIKSEAAAKASKIDTLEKLGETLKSEKDDLETNLSQLRLRSKFQLNQLQKQLDSTKDSKSDANMSSHNVDELNQKIKLLEDELSVLRTQNNSFAYPSEISDNESVSFQPALKESFEFISKITNTKLSPLNEDLSSADLVKMLRNLIQNQDINVIKLENCRLNDSGSPDIELTSNNEENANGSESDVKSLYENQIKKLSNHHLIELKSAEEKYTQLKLEFETQKFQLDMLRTNNESKSNNSAESVNNLALNKNGDFSNIMAVEKDSNDSLVKQPEEEAAKASSERALEEQIKDFKIQIASRQVEINSLQKKLSAKTDEIQKGFKERDDKLKKLKGLLLAANKHITDTKKMLGEKESEISKLVERNENLSSLEVSYKEKITELESNAEKLNSFISTVEQEKSLQNEDLKKRIGALEGQLNDAQVEFQNYRARAQLVLQQNGSAGYEKRIEVLEGTISKLERENVSKSSEILDAKAKINKLEEDIINSGEINNSLHSELIKLRNESEKITLLDLELNKANENLRLESETHKSAMDKLKTGYEKVIESLRSELSHTKNSSQLLIGEKSVVIKKLEKQLQESNDKKEQLEEQLKKMKENLDRLKTLKINEVSDSQSRSGTDLKISTTVSAQNLSSAPLDSYKEKEYIRKIDQLNEILNDNQSDIDRYLQQIEFLKKECQKIEKFDKGQFINLEYAKNILLSFIESHTRSQLVPVISQVLSLTPKEIERVRQAVNEVDSKAKSTSFGFF